MIKLKATNKIRPDEFDEIWVVTRSANKLPPTLMNNPKVKLVPDLSPEKQLFFKYLDWKKNNNWCFELFEQRYVPLFLEEIRNNKKSLELIDELVARSHTENIALVCFCASEYMCHRCILGGILMNKGATIDCNTLYERYSL